MKLESGVEGNLSAFRSQNGIYSQRDAKNMEYETNCTATRNSQILIPQSVMDINDHFQFMDMLCHRNIWK